MPGLAQAVSGDEGQPAHFSTALSANFDAGRNADVKEGVTIRGDGQGSVWLGDDGPLGERGQEVQEAVVVVAVPAFPFYAAGKILQVTGFRQLGELGKVDGTDPPFVKTAEQDKAEGANRGAKPPVLR